TALTPLVEAGWSLVVFPTGTRSRDGRVGPLRSGAAVLAARHALPIVPVHITGTRAAMPVGSNWMVRPQHGGRLGRHRIGVTFGAPLAVAADDEPRAVMEKVRLFLAAQGEETTPEQPSISDPAPVSEVARFAEPREV
ncbi:MAG: 1-acyl-sn-glycerol-3-phosphate acyltransferase, partial [Actinobacteria bacterium]|nr:1-acyl-sn-glycerol-3-phosphate acyltransferase [Actinomycetota bacterium]